MTGHLRLRIHVTEPWNFERSAGTADLTGWTTDHVDPDDESWEIHLDEGFEYNERHIDALLASPRYVGERLSRIFDTVTGFPVRLAHRQDGEWQYAFAATMTKRFDRDDGREDQDEGSIL